MPFIGNQPAESYASFLTETFTVSATASYTLSHAVTNENDIRLVINGVVQQPGSGKAYTASGTTLTLTSATVSGDVMYAVYLGRALQTVNPPNASVGSAQIADSLISGKTALGATPADTDELLISDAGTLKRVDYSHLKSVNTPAFEAYLSSAQSVSDATETKVQCDTEVFDSDGCYDNSTNYRFTPTVAGKYFVYVNLLGKASGNNLLASQIATIKKNGSEYAASNTQFYTNYEKQYTLMISHIIDMNGSSDYVEFFGYVNIISGSATFSVDSPKANVFGAYKINT